jgi:hypothetical protein
MRSKRRRWEEHCAGDTIGIGKRCDAAAPPFSPHPQGAALLRDCGVVLRSKPEGLRPRTLCVLELLAFAQNRQRQIDPMVQNSL